MVALAVGGIQTTASAALPWFTSDRFDLYRGGTNDVPWTLQYIGDVPRVDDDLGDIRRYDFSSGGQYVQIAVAPYIGTMIRAGGQWDADWDFNTYSSSGFGMWDYLILPAFEDDLYRAPLTFYAEFMDRTYGDVRIEMMQIEWIDPSWQRCLDHVWAGFCVAIPADLVVFILSGVISPVLQVLRAL